MNKSETLAHELRMMAGKCGDWVAGPISAVVLREAADTIEGLLESYGKVTEQVKRDDGGELESCSTRWHELFGTPERAARTLEKHCDGYHCIVCPANHHGCNDGDYDTLVEWLRGDA